ncbi:MAG TPA: potassium channel family protein [Gaiella sp.]|nr:potassium channel family protein [Gaiella sp.]
MRVTIEERLQRRIEKLTIVRAVRMVAFVALSLAVVAAVVEWAVDPGIGSFRDSLWWAVTTVTTVGYGDVVPTSTGGRLVGSILMLAGVSAIPIATSLVVSIFVTRLQEKERERDAEARKELLDRLERIEQALLARESA